MSRTREIEKNSEPRSELLDLCFQLNAIRIDFSFPFRWTSGAMMPVYCDSRLLLYSPRARRLIRQGFLSLLNRLETAPGHIVGIATGGIPHAALLADLLDLPMEYARSKPKEHGTRCQVEGLPEQNYRGQHVILIEDVVSTGGSLLRAAESVRELGGRVLAGFSVYSYEFAETAAAFADRDVFYDSILGFPDLFRYLEERNHSAENLALLREWHQDPFGKERGNL